MYTHIPFLGSPPHPGIKVISPFIPHLAKPPRLPLAIPWSNTTDRCKAIFLQAMGGLFGRKDPPTSPIRSAPQLGSAAGQDQPLSSSSPPILSTRYCSPQLPPAFHLSVLPCGEYRPFPPPRCCTGFIFVAKVVSVPAGDRRGPFLLVLFLSLFLFFVHTVRLVCKLFYRGKKGK